jgi:hypothetical protein
LEKLNYYLCCFHKQPPVLFGQFYHVAGGEEKKGKGGWKAPILKLKKKFRKTKRSLLGREVIVG